MSGALAHVGLGANLGERRRTLERALELLGREPGIRVAAVSRLRETAAVGGPPGQPPYLNGAARLYTTLAPSELLGRLLAIESALGRTREVRWGPRTVDLDLLLMADETIETPALVLPHPRLRERLFVLEALCDLDPELLVPGSRGAAPATVAELLDALRGGDTMHACAT